jgi:putative oxidoreductase
MEAAADHDSYHQLSARNDRMNFRHKYLVTAVRIILGLVMLFAGVSGLLAGKSPQGVPAQLVPTMGILWDSGILHMIKVTEAIAGLMLVLGFLPWLAVLFLAPDVVGIVIFNARLFPTALPIGIAVFALTAYLGYAYWDKYRGLFTRA